MDPHIPPYPISFEDLSSYVPFSPSESKILLSISLSYG
jgi:hypothetical protein